MTETYDIKRTDRVFLVGSTGSGKTTLAKGLLWGKRSLIVLDPKQQFTLPESWPHGSFITNSLEAVRNVDGPETVIYRPPFHDDAKAQRQNDFFQYIFERQNVTVYIDEVFPIVPNNRIGYWYGRCIQEGRGRGISIWSATQRPAAIPLNIMTESEHFFVFRLLNPDDRERMGKWGAPILSVPIPSGYPHGFYYFSVRTGKARFWKRSVVRKELE